MGRSLSQLLLPAFLITLAITSCRDTPGDSSSSLAGPGGIGNTTGNSHLQLWLRAQDGMRNHDDGERIATWYDQSGAENHVSSSGSDRPTFLKNSIQGVPGIRFNGAQYLQTPSATSSFRNTEATLFVVKKGGTRGASLAIAAHTWVSEFLFFKNSAYHHSSSGNFTKWDHQCIDAIPDDRLAIVCGVFGKSPNDVSYYVNGEKSTIRPWQASSPWDYKERDRIITVGQRGQFVSSEYLNGTLYEVIGYNRKLRDDERIAVEDYLRCKYRITNDGCGNLFDDPCGRDGLR